MLNLVVKERCPPLAALATIFRDPVKEVLEEVVALARTIKEDVIGKNYDALVYGPTTEFTPTTMALEDSEDSATTDDRVACTTRFGLQYYFKQGRMYTEASGSVTLLKAQVVTMAVLDDMREPTTSTSAGRNQSARGPFTMQAARWA